MRKFNSKKPLRILVLPDSQVKPGENYAFLHNQGMYMRDKKPDIVVDLSDFSDMQSLSSYDKGKRAAEGKRYANDVEATRTAMKIRMKPIRDYNIQQLVMGQPIYHPPMFMTLGNHEQRTERATQEDPALFGAISVKDLGYEEMGFEVIPHLEILNINDVLFSHFFTSGTNGRPCSTARAMLAKKHMSCVAGHQQGLQIATDVKGDGTTITCIIAGSAYEHDEAYLGPQGNSHWRGIIMLHNVINGSFDPVMIPNSYLAERYNPTGKKYLTCPGD